MERLPRSFYQKKKGMVDMHVEDIRPGHMVTFTTGSASARVVTVNKKSGIVEIELVKDFTQEPGGVLFPKGHTAPFPAIELRPLN